MVYNGEKFLLTFAVVYKNMVKVLSGLKVLVLGFSEVTLSILY